MRKNKKNARRGKAGGNRQKRGTTASSSRTRTSASRRSHKARAFRDPQGFERHRHIPESLRSYITGIVDMKSSGKAYILPDNKELEDVFIAPNSVGHALHGDHVRVLLFPSRAGHRIEGQIVEVLKRNKRNIVGTLEFSGKFAFVIPDNSSITVNVIVPREELKGVLPGQKVVARITEWPPHLNHPTGEIVAVLGRPGDNDVEMQSILAEFDFPLSYPKDAEKQAAGLDGRISSEEVARRRDFRQTYTCTIDPADAKDFDDALSFRTLPNGNFEIGIHIADVSHFVKPDTAIDREAYERATSVYLVDRTIPMLPERLCNDLCSLNPNVDRYTFSVVFEMDAQAQIVNFWIGKGIIHSDRRYTYEEAQAILEAAGLVEGVGPDPSALKASGSSEQTDALCRMFRISKILREKRFQTGAINFRSQEVRFRLDPVTAKPLGVYLKESKESNHLVEEFMLLANRRVAETIGKNLPVVSRDNGIWGSENDARIKTFDKERAAMAKADQDARSVLASGSAEPASRAAVKAQTAKTRTAKTQTAKTQTAKAKARIRTFVYRVHDEPNPDKLASFTQFVGKLGYKINLKNRSGLVKSFNRLLETVEGKPEQNMIENIAVRTMAKAYYSTHNMGHYGLAFPFYTHFTSPIRRYPDLMVHRLLEHYIAGGSSADSGLYEEKCEHSSDMEKKAAEAERASVKYKQAEYLLEKVGQKFFGAISGVSKWGIYVCLDENYCEGMVPLRSLRDDYYELDEDNYRVVGVRSGQVYKLGQRVQIIVQEIDMAKKQLTFAFVERD